MLPATARGTRALAATAQTMPLSLATAGWRVSTGPLVWNRRRADLAAVQTTAAAPIVWAGRHRRGARCTGDPVRDRLRYLALRHGRDAEVMCLGEPAVLVQRTTAPEQSRRVVAADLAPDVLAAWGGRVVVENHVNVVQPTSSTPLVGRACLARVLATPTVDRLVRCLSGSVALSAYELESLPLPDAAVLAGWERLRGDELDEAVAAAYGGGGA